MADATRFREELLERYLEQLPFEPYPIQENALYAWFSAEQGVLVCTPTGTGKTVIAEAAMFEALHAGKTAYYTTPLIALTEQKFREMQDAAVRWGFERSDVGLVTGNRRENPDARILVVVAEILFNRLLHSEAFDFSEVSAVVMDEFHSFADAERGIVWEFSLGLLPKHVRLLLLSATVGNAVEFSGWLRRCHDRKLDLVQGDQRKVPLTFQWVPDKLLTEQIEWMSQGSEDQRTTPSLIFCFNREECWTIAEQLKGKHLIDGQRQKLLDEELRQYDWSQGAGPKLRPLLLRGVGVHHAGVLPKYRRIVEDLYQRKLLSIATCTETLAAGINLPARSVVLPSILKGPSGKRKLLDASSAHQIFGRAGRPQFDSQGYVFVLAHEDDVKISRWKDKYDQIPEDTKDPGLLKAKKQLKKKMPKRRSTEQYWTEEQFEKLRTAPAGHLVSRGPLPWRLLSYMLDASPDVDRVRTLVQKRLMDPKWLERANRDLDQMLLTLWRAGYVTLEPEPVVQEETPEEAPKPKSEGMHLFGMALGDAKTVSEESQDRSSGPPPYQAKLAHPTERLELLRMFRGVNPLYGVFLINQLGIADRAERIQAMESVLELPRSIGPAVRVPRQEFLPPGPLATTRLDVQLLQLGLATPEELVEQSRDEDRPYNSMEERVWVLALADKLRRMFDYDFPGVRDVRTFPVWAVGELLEFGGDFNKYITSKQLQKQEGILFRHFLRMILLVAEFASLTPPDAEEAEWRGDLEEITNVLAESCRRVDPTSTEKTLEQAQAEEAEFE
ncbi:MAG: DEAD/DEAH box helicase [Planctomycetaceae bacterium]|nr:DEAD/DEAH box helicase [Planctomycetaceae bacterium]